MKLPKFSTFSSLAKTIFLIILLLFIFFGKLSTTAHAQSVTPVPDPCLIGGSSPDTVSDGSDVDFTSDPPSECIEEGKVVNVNVTFHGLTAGRSDYYMCTGDVSCLSQDPQNLLHVLGQIIGSDGKTHSGSNTDGKTFAADAQTGDVTIKVCGDGSNKVKVGDACPDNSKDNYFWGGNIYYMSLGIVSKDGFYTAVKRGGFYVSRSYPTLTVSPNKGITTKTTLKATVAQDFIRNGGGKRNNYQIDLAGGEAYEQSNCFTISAQGANGSKGDTYNNLSVGTYILSVREQTNDSKDGVSLLLDGKLSNSGCKGGFTYLQVKCNVTNPNDKSGGGSCSDPALGKDPKGEEYKAFLHDLSQMNKVSAGISLPCGDGIMRTSSTPCGSVNTAIGLIDVTPQGFVISIFKLVLVLATFGGVIIILFAGYTFMTSRGDKEKIAAARETLTSAIVGLLFIVLSIVILEIIGVDVLRIPGFGR